MGKTLKVGQLSQKTGYTTVNPKSPTPPLTIKEHTQVGFSQLNNLNKTLECRSPRPGTGRPGDARLLSVPPEHRPARDKLSPGAGGSTGQAEGCPRGPPSPLPDSLTSLGPLALHAAPRGAGMGPGPGPLLLWEQSIPPAPQVTA